MLAAVSAAGRGFVAAAPRVSQRYIHCSATVWAGDLEAKFVAAKAAVQKVPTVDNMDKLQLYALYKQATAGVNSTPAPGMLDFVVSSNSARVLSACLNASLHRAKQSGMPG